MECSRCGAFFGSEETLIQHMERIHSLASTAAGVDAEGSESEEEGGCNLELAPILTLLTDEQKDVVILRALQRDPALAEELLTQAEQPLLHSQAEERLKHMTAEAAVAGVKAFAEIDAHENALTMLRAITVALKAVLERVCESFRDGGCSASAELEAVERLPAASTVGSLWCDLLQGPAKATFEPAVASDVRELLSAIQHASARIREKQPALLIGPEGGTVASIAEALALLPSERQSAPQRKKARR